LAVVENLDDAAALAKKIRPDADPFVFLDQDRLTNAPPADEHAVDAAQIAQLEPGRQPAQERVVPRDGGMLQLHVAIVAATDEKLVFLGEENVKRDGPAQGAPMSQAPGPEHSRIGKGFDMGGQQRAAALLAELRLVRVARATVATGLHGRDPLAVRRG
jgi:hypothetical protein